MPLEIEAMRFCSKEKGYVCCKIGPSDAVVDLENPVLQFSPSFSPGYVSTNGAKQIVHCDRVQIGGMLLLDCVSAGKTTRRPSKMANGMV
ncbi:hypothetical protein C5167_042092 [Papaver somniferum]|nr:hypothetical protein C5167_042092 [Papaver somniferum]